MTDRALAGPEALRYRLLLATAPLLALAIGAGATQSPVLVAAAIVAIAFAVVAFVDLAAGLAVFTVLIFFTRIPALSSSGLTIVKLAGGVLALSWLLKIGTRAVGVPLLVRDHGRLAYVALLLAAWAFASMLWAADAGTVVTTASRLAQGIVLLFIVYSGLRDRRRVGWIVAAFIAGAVLSAVVGLAGATSAERFNPHAEQQRLTGGIGDPNELAAILVPAVAFALFALAIVRRTALRWLLIAAIVVSALALFRTESRGGIIGLGTMMIAAILLAGPIRGRIVAAVLSFTGIAIFYLSLIAPPQALARLTEFSGGGTGRTELWTIALHVFANHPVGGVGAGNFSVVEPAYAFGDINIERTRGVIDQAQPVHNTFLHVLSELGVLGFALFAALLIGTFVVAWRAVRRFAYAGDRQMEILTRGLIVGVVGMLASFVFVSAQYEKQLPLLLATLIALSSLPAARSSGARLRARGRVIRAVASPA